ncbi:putative Tic20 family protein [Arcanobacterium wilhelmae]|uniref:Tic20 family protein n=1 Tax=Arcanobacterium wilhelmae TaxID=1803177 RepID=A0ABT9NC44_9ACTO|nr:DUF4870 domain-containing protein [Arcanobacterium wilhelmae]MDP9801297.1 putative Tic20 family protein [Arcanobacterium wilhelmae]WFN90642.1 DUF4870 domain-containing protein [Arcanobacterium wilhelmae]
MTQHISPVPPSSEDRTWAIAAHLSALIGWVVSAGWLAFVGPLVIWLVKKEDSAFVRSAAAQSFNFNLGTQIMSWIGWICIFTIILIPVGLFLFFLSFVLLIWGHLRATIATSNNRLYRYPFQLPVLS